MDDVIEGVFGGSDEDQYIAPREPQVIEKLEQFRDMKLGFMTHFGMYSQLGIYESWALSDELETDRWSQIEIDWETDIEKFKQQYWELNKSFNPIRLDPKRLANTIVNCGFKYAIMPTKHHDGFCLWDTAYTDYKSTNVDCPFSKHEYADAFGSLIAEVQNSGLVAGAYFSKPDWHNTDYWPESFRDGSATHCHPGYDIFKNPEKWQRYAEFTAKQMIEIVDNYQQIDIMWLDGLRDAVECGEDIKIMEIVKKMREINPALIVCDRNCGGEAENYITPEQSIPDDFIAIPWESCVTLGKYWGFHYNDQYKTPKEVAEIFVNILCKGGNLVLNPPLQPNGAMPTRALAVLSEFGDWVQANKHAIYGTRPVAPYYQKGDGLVSDKQGQKYLFIQPEEDQFIVPKYLYSYFKTEITSAEYNGKDVVVEKIGNKYKFTMPVDEVDRKEPLYYVLKIN